MPLGRRFDPTKDVPDPEELEGKRNLEKNDFLALIIAGFSVFLPVALLFIGLLALLIYLIFGLSF